MQSKLHSGLIFLKPQPPILLDIDAFEFTKRQFLDMQRWIIMIPIAADGYNVKRYVIFNLKTIQKESFPVNIIVRAQEKLLNDIWAHETLDSLLAEMIIKNFKVAGISSQIFWPEEDVI